MSESPILQTASTATSNSTSVIQSQTVSYNIGSMHQATTATKAENKTENQTGNNSAIRKQGVLLDGKFIETEWPEGISENEEVTVKVISNKPELKVSISVTPNQQSDSKPIINKELQQIESLLKQIKLSSEQTLNYKLNENEAKSLANIKNNIILQVFDSKNNTEDIINFLNNQTKLNSEEIKDSLNKIKNLFENKRNISENLKELFNKLSNNQSNNQANNQNFSQLGDIRLNYYSEELSLKNDRLINILKTNLDPLGLAEQSLNDIKIKIKDANLTLPKNLNDLINKLEKTISSKLNTDIDLNKALELSKNLIKEINNNENLKTLKPQALALNAHLQNAQFNTTEIVASNSSINLSSIETIENNQLLKELITSSKSVHSKLQIKDLLIKSIDNQQKTITEIKDLLTIIEKGTNLDLIKSSLTELSEWANKNNTLPISSQILNFAQSNLLELNKSLDLNIKDRELFVLKILNNINKESLNFLDQLDQSSTNSNIEHKKLANILNKLIGITDSTLESLQESHYELIDNIGESLNKDLTKIIKELAKFSKESVKTEHKELNIIIFKLTNQIENLQNQIIKDPSKENISNLLNELKSSLLIDLDKISDLNLDSKNIKELINNLQKVLTNSQVTSNLLNPEHTLDSLISEFSANYAETNTADIKAPTNISKALQTLESILKTNWLTDKTTSTNNTNKDIAELVKLLNTIKDISINLEDQELSGVVNIINNNAHDLQNINKQNEQVQQAFINKLNNQLKKELDKIITPQNLSNDNQILKALSSVENIIKGQEALQQMAPILQATGEPIFLMFPMLMQGFMSKVELQHYGQHATALDPDKKNNKNNENDKFQRTDLSLSLEGLGNINVELAYNSKQIFCNFKMENQSAIEHLQDLLPLLSTAFSKLGYQDIDCKSSILEKSNKTAKYQNKSSLVIA